VNQLGYYGKTPHRGDFVRFNLPQAFLKVWDDWLQQVMILGEGQCQDWAQLYTHAPAWRFVLSGGIAGNTPWIGVLRASQDKVGRRFPFCLAMSLSENTLPCASLNSNARWFDDADRLLDHVLADNDMFDELQDELAVLAEKHAQQVVEELSNSVAMNNTRQSDAVTISVMSGNALCSSQSLPAVLDTVLKQTLGEYSLWMASAPTEVTVINAGLPVDQAGLALFSADWAAASTAQINADLLSAISSLDAAPQSGDDKKTNQSIHTGATTAAVAEETLDDAINGLADTTDDSGVQSVETLNENLHTAAVEQVPSDDDWAALDNFDDTSIKEPKIPLPEVEPLELDEDDLPDAPWES